MNISNTYSSGKTGSTIFHTSFEEDGNYAVAAYTGEKARQGSYTIYLPAQNGCYILTYMKWNASVPGNWELIKQNISVTSGTVQALTIGDASTIMDEVRLYPVWAQMTTYTYKPEYGVSSVADVNSSVTYYAYDSFGRLEYVKDNKQNILKTFKYHYKGQN